MNNPKLFLSPSSLLPFLFSCLFFPSFFYFSVLSLNVQYINWFCSILYTNLVSEQTFLGSYELQVKMINLTFKIQKDSILIYIALGSSTSLASFWGEVLPRFILISINVGHCPSCIVTQRGTDGEKALGGATRKR